MLWRSQRLGPGPLLLLSGPVRNAPDRSPSCRQDGRAMEASTSFAYDSGEAQRFASLEPPTRRTPLTGREVDPACVVVNRRPGGPIKSAVFPICPCAEAGEASAADLVISRPIPRGMTGCSLKHVPGKMARNARLCHQQRVTRKAARPPLFEPPFDSLPTEPTKKARPRSRRERASLQGKTEFSHFPFRAQTGDLKCRRGRLQGFGRSF